MSTSRLPERASLDYLKKLAKERLRAMRTSDPDAKLASAQLAIAREHGFSSWRAMKADVDQRRAPRIDEWFAAVEARDLDRLRAMLDADPSLVHERHSSGSTPLHYLVADANAVRMLLEHGADPNVRDIGDNATPLHVAAGGGHLESVRLLLDAGADVHGHGDLHESDVIGWATSDGVEPRRDVIALLLERGAKHHIFSAMAMDDIALVESIVEENPDALTRRRSRFEQKQTPLHFAIAAPDGLRPKTPQHAMLDLLIELGANVEAEDARGRTPLAVAMMRGDIESMRRLKATGAKEPKPVTKTSSTTNIETIRAGMTSIIPMLCVSDATATVEWYQSLGFKLEDRIPDTGPIGWAMMSFGKVRFMVQPRVARPHAQVALWFYTGRVEEMYEMFRRRQLAASQSAAEGNEASPRAMRFEEDLYEPFYGGKQFSISDPNGFELVFYQEDNA